MPLGDARSIWSNRDRYGKMCVSNSMNIPQHYRQGGADNGGVFGTRHCSMENAMNAGTRYGQTTNTVASATTPTGPWNVRRKTDLVTTKKRSPSFRRPKGQAACSSNRYHPQHFYAWFIHEYTSLQPKLSDHNAHLPPPI